METIDNDVWNARRDESVHSKESEGHGNASKDVSERNTRSTRVTRLLLVDDDPFALEAVSHTLRHSLPAVTIETYMDPVPALLRLRAESFAVVLSDFNMPDMNGLRLLRAARECGSEASFIVMTGDATEGVLTEGLLHGMFGLLHKPFNRAALIPLVQQAIECHRLRQEVAELRRTLIDSGLEGNAVVPSAAARTNLLQHLLPF